VLTNSSKGDIEQPILNIVTGRRNTIAYLKGNFASNAFLDIETNEYMTKDMLIQKYGQQAFDDDRSAAPQQIKPDPASLLPSSSSSSSPATPQSKAAKPTPRKVNFSRP
jgi:hypothetical protein